MEQNKKKRAINAKPYTLAVFTKIANNSKFGELYDSWAKLEPRDKERVLLNFTLLPTPAEWISTLTIKGQEIKYIKQHIAKRILNLLFGVGNWYIEITKIDDINTDNTFQAFGYGYLVIKWFDGTERRVATAGSGKVYTNNVVTGKGDDTKMVISDMTKKALANLGFFADVYGSAEAVEDHKGTLPKEEDKPHYDYQLLKSRVDALIADYMDGVDVEDRLIRAKALLTKAGYNDLLLKVEELITKENK